ncbi:ABC transporter ATP-binding protein [Proteocatella sphenisci]|uniref:ABC transporter ATP-binding protein n=1 Tax=Proteocatella sphenisci TaxID=181070 RepID=UPI00048FB644|nr:ABC transporter ATP-binding protein [Proteocatella sphenisci]
MFLELRDITKLYDKDNGIRNISFSVEQGEFVTLLGPSGCGKTTTLNIIGGFLKPDSGKVILDGQDITGFVPEERPVSTVFQSYALFPHMNVLDNVSYGLRHLCRMSKKSAAEEALKYLEIVGLSGYEHSQVGNLSGGQQQRVALARSMATKPKLLLMDEPLSNLDASLRIKMRLELKNLQRKLGITMILVTHDQEEALSMSDKIIVMEKGDILQIGSPQDIYFSPQSREVSSFIGRANFVDINGKTELIRPENIRIIPDEKGNYRITDKIFMGARTEYIVSDGKNTLEVEISGVYGTAFEKDQSVSIEI